MTNREIADAFASNTDQDKTGRGNSCQFEGAVFWSYSTPVARKDEANRMARVTDTRYSQTTTRICNMLVGALTAAGYRVTREPV